MTDSTDTNETTRIAHEAGDRRPQLGPYRLDRLIGRGGMAEVHRAWHTSLRRHEALKLLLPQAAADRSFVERFLNEARIAAGLRHPHIATIHAVSAPGEEPYFTMELIEGPDLADLLDQRGALSPQEALPLLRQIASALDYAHERGIIHRDVKPANVLLQRLPDGGCDAKVVDFGIARAQETGGKRLTRTGMIVGTPEYMSPEQAGSGAAVGAHTDQYSLAVVAYQMLCGRPPFGGGGEASAVSVIMQHVGVPPRPPVELAPGLPPSVSSAILRALAKDPAARFATCLDFVQALSGAAVSTAAANAARRTQVGRPKPAPARATARHAIGIGPMQVGAGVLALLGMGLIAFGLLRGGHAGDASAQLAPTSRPAPQSPALDPPQPAPDVVRVPDLGGMKEGQARDFAAARKLLLDEHTEYSGVVPVGRVARQSPRAGVSTRPQSTVGVWISLGPAPPVPATSTAGAQRPVTAPPVPAPAAARLTEADLVGKSDYKLDLLRNEYYARHGYEFARPDLRRYFSAFPWYHGHTRDANAVERGFSPTERHNANLIAEFQHRNDGNRN